MVATLLAEAKDKIQAGALNVMELLGVAGNLAAEGAWQQQMELYQEWIAANPDSAYLPAIYFNYGIVLSERNMLEQARDAYLEALRINQNFFQAYINLASALERLGQTDEAVAIYRTLVDKLALITSDTISYKNNALTQISRILKSQGRYALAEETLCASLNVDKRQPEIILHLIDVRLKQCKWPLLSLSCPIDKQQLIREMAPLTAAVYSDDPLLQLCTSYAYTKKVIGRTGPVVGSTVERAAKAPGARLRVGYLSSDLRGHAVGSLMAEVFGLHDRDKVEVFAYFCGPRGTDYFQTRIMADVDHWIDIGEMNDQQAASRISGDGIEILVDVNGHTADARTRMLALRPAPIIVNWLGFPGTMASLYHNYLIADGYIIPEGHEIFYSEKVMRLPCYQPNDRKRLVSRAEQLRRDHGLPDGAFVYCCFNGCQKITQLTFNLWMDILRQVPDSVLWLLGSNLETNSRLKEHALQSGVAPERLLFAEVKPNPEHMARLGLADLFLDTFPYGAHTTCSDALWMGVPVLTLSGQSFASRVGGSLVRSAGIEELVSATPLDYVSKAVQLGSNPERLALIKGKLAQQKQSCVLFDMPLLVRSMEGLFARMWEEYVAGTLPVPDLANLDLYHEIAAEIDHDHPEFPTLPYYLEKYRVALEERNRSYPIKPDRRLWPAPGLSGQ